MAYIARRLVLAFFAIWVISIISFFIMIMPPGDSLERYIENLENGGVEVSIREAAYLRNYYGLDKPAIYRYWVWVKDILRGDFGYGFTELSSVQYGGVSDGYGGFQQSTKDLVGERLVLTMFLGVFTISITWVLAIPIGIYSAVRQHSVGDYVFTFLGFSGLAVPDFLLGLVLMYIAFAYFDQLVGGLFSSNFLQAPWFGSEYTFGIHWAKMWDFIKHLWIPGVVLGTAGTAGLIRIMRNNLLDELTRPYVLTAVAKGMPYWKAIIKYPVRVAINPFVSGIGQMLPSLISGSIIVSVVLGLPLVGPILLRAVLFEEVQVASFIILALASLTVIGTLISDLLLVVIDPRIRLMNE